MTKGKTFLFLVTITIASAIIRFNQLGKIPNGLATDEADIGYNAYSIAKTGADVYGRKFPLFFQSLDDYKPGLVFYITIPAIAAFGLNDFSVRLAPAIFGTLSIILLFVLTKTLYPKNQLLPYISALFVSFAPWHIALSRAMIQYIPLIFLYLLFFVLFLFTQKEYLKTQVKLILLFLSFLTLSLTLYVYYAAIIYLPLVLIVLTYLYRDFISKNLKSFLFVLLIILIFSLPAIAHYAKKESKTRLNAISVLTADVTLPTSIAEIEQDKREGQPFSQIIHNRRLVYASALLDNYFDYFNLDYLFVNARDIRYFYVHNVGLFYLFELPFFFYGLYSLLKRREKSDLLILALLVIGPIPAAITLGSPLPHRGILTILAIQLISSVGLTTLTSNILRAKREVSLKTTSRSLSGKFLPAFPVRTIITIFLLAYAASIYFFLHQYFIHSPREFVLGGWFPVVRDAIPTVNRYQDRYDKIVFTWLQPRLVPPVYFLFYNQIDPKNLQAKASGWMNEPPSYRQIYSQIDKIEFRPINWEQDKNLKSTLFVGYADEFSADAKVIDRTYLPNGNPHFVFVETQ